jgi:hypothetical protein
MARALGVNIVSTFDSKGIRKAITDFKKLEGAGNKATFGLRTFDKAVTNGAKKVAKFGAMAGAAFGAVGFGLVKVAEAAATSNARIEQINKSMGLFGGATQQVTDRLVKLAETQAMATGIDRNAIKETVAKLLTFKELAATATEVGGAFDRATQAAIDLSAAGFGEATENATQLGKALNDPIKGITALNRSGVTFTEQEKEKIKVLVESGKILEAQDILLKAIEMQVGGTAVATANASDQMRQGLGMAAESLGNLLLPAFNRLVDFINNKVVPNVQKFADVVGEEGLGAGLRMLGDGFLTAVSNGGKFVNTLLVLTAAFVAMRGVAIAATIAQNLFNVALLKNPIGLIITAIYLLGVGLVAAYVKFEGFRKVVLIVVNAAIAAWEFMTNVIIKGINFLIDAYNGLIKIANFFGAGIEEVGKIGAVSFGRIGSAAKKTESQLVKTLGLIQTIRNNERKGFVTTFTPPEIDPPVGGSGESPIEKAKKALQKYTDAIKGVTQAQRSLREANKGVNESNKSLLEKTKALAEAQKRFNLITKGFGRDSKEAKNAEQERTKAERSAERAKYALEEAIFAIKDAEDELKKVRQDPASTPQMIREAEIRLAQAKLSVADATDDQKASVDALAASQQRLDEVVNGAKEGSDAYRDALDDLLDAEKAQRDAIDARTQAYEKQADAVAKLTEAEKDRYESGLVLSKKAKAKADAAADSGVVTVPAIISDGGGAIGEGFFGIPKTAEQIAAEKGRLTPDQARELERRRGITPFANGGIVTKAMLGLVGEAGAEAIIPLDRMGSMGSTYNIQVTAGMGADGKDIGTQIVNALKRYERTNGALPLTVA